MNFTFLPESHFSEFWAAAYFFQPPLLTLFPSSDISTYESRDSQMGVIGADSRLRQGPGSFQSCFHCPSKPLKAHWDPKAHCKRLTWKANSNRWESGKWVAPSQRGSLAGDRGFFFKFWVLITFQDSTLQTRWVNSLNSCCCSVAQLCPTLCNPMDCSTPGFPVLHCLPELAQTHVHWVGDAIQPSCPLSSLSPPAFNISQHQGLFQWVSSLHQVAKVLELQLQHQFLQWIFRIDWFDLLNSPQSHRWRPNCTLTVESEF